jgi:hypothetical protein
MTSARGEGSGCHKVVAWGREKVKTLILQTVAILHNTTYRSLTTLLGTSQSLILKSRDTSGLVAWRWVLAYRLSVREEVVLEVIDE